MSCNFADEFTNLGTPFKKNPGVFGSSFLSPTSLNGNQAFECPWESRPRRRYSCQRKAINNKRKGKSHRVASWFAQKRDWSIHCRLQERLANSKGMNETCHLLSPDIQLSSQWELCNFAISLGDAKEVIREATKHKQDIDDNDIMTDRKGPQNPQGWFLKHSAQTWTQNV